MNPRLVWAVIGLGCALVGLLGDRLGIEWWKLAPISVALGAGLTYLYWRLTGLPPGP